MTDKELEMLLALAEERRQKNLDPEEALRFMIRAGIWDENGEFTAPYANLGAACTTIEFEKNV